MHQVIQFDCNFADDVRVIERDYKIMPSSEEKTEHRVYFVVLLLPISTKKKPCS